MILAGPSRRSTQEKDPEMVPLEPQKKPKRVTEETTAQEMMAPTRRGLDRGEGRNKVEKNREGTRRGVATGPLRFLSQLANGLNTRTSAGTRLVRENCPSMSA